MIHLKSRDNERHRLYADAGDLFIDIASNR